MNQRDDSSYELISAYLDGELTPDERARVEQLVNGSDDYRQSLNELRAVVGGMKLLPSYHLDRAFPQRVMAAARDAGVAFDVDTPQQPQPAHTQSSAHVWHWPAAVGLLTTVAAAVVVAVLVWHPGGEWLTPNSHQLISQVSPGDVGAPTGPSPSSPAALPDTLPLRDDRTDVADPSAAAARVAEHTVADSAPATVPGEVAPDGAEPVRHGKSEPSNIAMSPSGPAPTVVDPSAAPSPAAAGAGTDVARRQVVGQPPLMGDDRLPGREIVGVPFSGTQQLLLVLDVALTQQGREKGAFEQTLATHGVAIEGTVPVDAKLEASLLATRFFEPAKTEPENMAAARPDLALMYVKTRAGHVDEMWRAMQSNQSEFSRVTLDMAFLADDQTMFQELRRAVDQQAVDVPAVADQENRARRAAAHRLTLSPSWRGTPVSKLKGVNELAGLVPDWMLGQDAGKKEPVEGMAGQPAPRVALPPGGRLGENIDAEVLFVVHVGRIPQE